jgi:hypothetical protein
MGFSSSRLSLLTTTVKVSYSLSDTSNHRATVTHAESIYLRRLRGVKNSYEKLRGLR